MDHVRKEIINSIISQCQENGFAKTPIKELSFYTHDKPTQMSATLYEPSLCVIVQGQKTVSLDSNLISYDATKYLLSSTHIPAQVCITEASFDQPYLGLTISFSMEQIFEVIKEMGEKSYNSSSLKRGIYFGVMEEKLLEPILRLVRLTNVPEDAKILAPLIIKEILYIVMRSEGGDFIRQYILDSHSAQRVVQAITHIKENFSKTLDIKDLAKSIGMSESSFYANFKKITTLSPLQFQKTLRLQEARRMLILQDIEASEVSFCVGYESPSQFSREYVRMYGLPPKADIKRFKKGSLS